jgi:uncharacterized protein YjiS (DUF1127 family)
MFATLRLPRVVSIALFPPAISLGTVVQRQWRLFAQARRQRRATAELHGLSDRLLKDIGVPRSEIHWIARQGRRQQRSLPLLPRQ